MLFCCLWRGELEEEGGEAEGRYQRNNGAQQENGGQTWKGQTENVSIFQNNCPSFRHIDQLADGILPRIWPLKNVPDTYCPDTPAQCDIPAGKGTLGRAAACAAKKAGEARLRPRFFKIIAPVSVI